MTTSLLGHWPDEEELFPLLTGVNGRALVVVHQVLHGGELPLADAVQPALHVYPEVLVATGRLQRDGEVASLEEQTNVDS